MSLPRRKRFSNRMVYLGTLLLAPAMINIFMSPHFMRQPISKPLPNTWSPQDLTITWLGHASFLINVYGKTILIDPLLGSRAGVTLPGNYNIGRKRFIASPLTPQEFGPIDLLLMSHGHVDHFDYPTLTSLQSYYTKVVTAKNTAFLWEGLVYNGVRELEWGEELNVDGVLVKAIQGVHKAYRLPWQTDMTANGYLISYQGINIFFAGDTAYTPLIKEQLQGIPIDIAIFGIGNYWPPNYQANHATPEEAWAMAREIGAKWVIPMHWGTFRLSEEPMNEPIARFYRVAGPQASLIPINEVGQTWEI